MMEQICLPMKHKQTKKLFYRKWPYKVTYRIPGVSVLRERTLDQLQAYINDPPDRMLRWKGSFHTDIRLNSEVIIDMAYFLDSLPKEDFQIRLESAMLDVYTDKKELLQKLLTTHPDHITSVFSPAEGTEDLLKNRNVIIVNKYPEGRFKHKVFLAPHKIKDSQQKAETVKWIKSQSNLHITDTTAQWFIVTGWNWDRRYIMAEDEKSLLMLKLRCGDIVGAVYDYKVVDK